MSKFIAGLKCRTGRDIPWQLQTLTYFIWTAPERDLTTRDMRRVFRRVCTIFGYDPGWVSTQRYVWGMIRNGWVKAYWVRRGFYLDDESMELRQRCVFSDDLHETPFDKMDRIWLRYADPGVPYVKQGGETCDREELFRFVEGLVGSGSSFGVIQPRYATA